MSRRGCRAMCAGDQIKTTFCPAIGCSWSRSGNPRTVNQLKTMHLKVCPFIVDATERDAYLKNKSLKQITSGISRNEYVKASEKKLCLDPKENVMKEHSDAYVFSKLLEKEEIKQKRSDAKK